ncbi:MAG TPA: uroporphyrinogen decarboxylase family protein [bacterium]|nr:uroporphyrinogen decarboxylase family protein [bacterium]
MTHREHFCKIMKGDVSNWIPNYEYGLWGQTFERWIKEGMPEDKIYNNWFEGEPFFKIDRRGFAHINTGPVPAYQTEVIEETDRYIIQRNPWGYITKSLKEGTVRGTRPSMDQYISFPVTDRESFNQMKEKYNPFSSVRYSLWWDEWVKIWKKRDYPLCLLGNASWGIYSRLRIWVGTENLSYMFYDNPALVEEMIEFNVEFLLSLVEKALNEVEFDYFNFFEDCAGKGGPLFGPEIFKKFFLKPYKRVIERLKKAGIEIITLDTDGNFEVLIPLWMDAGINFFWPLEQASEMDPLKLRKKFGKNIILMGGIDKREIAKGKNEIEKELYKKIPPLLEQGGYIPTLDHAISPDISYENFMYYIELKLKLIGR